MRDLFPRVQRWHHGYHPGQVDEFFEKARLSYEGKAGDPITEEDVRSVAFDMVADGYQTATVDAALDRLEGGHRAEAPRRVHLREVGGGVDGGGGHPGEFALPPPPAPRR